jgi:predicted metal-binding membrane protein
VSTPAATLRRFSPAAAVLLFLAAAAWVLTIRLAAGMGVAPGTMGLGLAGFLGVWALMMTAMMLPSVVPLASMYVRSIKGSPAVRICGLAIGYLAVWTAAGIPAYGLARLAGRLAASHPTAATVMAVAIFGAAGCYQLTPLKDRCLAHCRSPLGLLLHYGSFRGRSRDLRVGLHHGGFCLGCCWALMGLLVAFGVMNVLGMLGLAGVVIVEKVCARGQLFSRLVGAAALALAVAVVFVPALAPGLQGPAHPMDMG